MDAIEMLKNEHQATAKAMEQIINSRIENIRGLFEALSEDLKNHDRIEEEIFYAAVQANGNAAGLAAMVKRGHLDVEACLANLSVLPAEGKGWMPAFKAMHEKVLRYVAEEENKFHATIRTLFKPAELNA